MRRSLFNLLAFFLYLILLPAGSAHGQSLPGHEGLQPFIRYFQPSDYHAHPQNWDVAQGPDGLIYVANTNGILQYDGYRWHKISMPDHKSVKRVELYNDTLFVGASHTWGYIHKDSTGHATFMPLVKKTEAAGINVHRIRMMVNTPKGLYFSSGSRLLRWYRGKLYPFPDSLVVKRIFDVPNHGLFANLRDGKIVTVNGTRVEPFYTGKALKNKAVRNMYDVGSGRLALFTFKKTYILKNNRVFPWITEAQSLLKGNSIVHTLRLPEGNLALATTKGLIVISPSGHLITNINQANGLPTGLILNIFADQSGSLWLALNNGLTVLNLNSPVSHFADNTFGGRVKDIAFYHHRLYIATTQNVYKLVSSRNRATFVKLFHTNTQYWSLLPTQQGLLLGYANGLLLIKGNGRPPGVVSTRPHVFSLTPSQYDSTTIYAKSKVGLFPIHLRHGKWETGNFIYEGRVGSTYVIGKNDLVTMSIKEGVLHIKMASDTVITQPFAKQKVSLSGITNIYKMGRLYAIPADSGLVWFSVKQKGIQVVPDPVPNLALKKVQPLDSITAWGWTGKAFFKLTKNDTGWHGKPVATGMFHPYHLDGLFPTKKHGLWISGDGKLVHIRTKGPTHKVKPPKVPVFRSIMGLNEKPINFNKGKGAVVGNQFKGFRINFSSLPYLSPNEIKYQTRLIGFNNQWSPWNREPFVNYSNLSPGHYTLKIRARNQANLISHTTTLPLYIEPCWYQTWWAKLIFAFLSLATLTGVIYLINQRYRIQSYRLRRRVAERTKELSESRNKISRQASRLKELNQIRTQFYTNISHELRTPLTLISGPIKDILADNINDPKKIQTALHSALRNSRRLHHLVTQLLDLEKIDSKNLIIRVSQNNLTDFVKKVISAFESYADTRGVTLTANIPTHPCYLYYDAEQLEKVLTNLISNAIKFTPGNGKATVTLLKDDDTIAIEVKDNGIGMNKDDMSHIFDRFYQADTSMAREEGIGVGLSLSHQLVELHHGELSVQSEPGEGSIFTIRLLKGKTHFENNQIIGKEGQQMMMTKNDMAEPVDLITPENEIQEPLTNKENEDRKTLLVIDDNADMCRYIRDIMEGSYRIIEANNGENGFFLAKDRLPDIILCDVMMPEMDGFSFSRKLRNHLQTASIPVIFLTGRADKKGLLEGLKSGADEYITKPFDAEILQVRIENMIERHMRLRKLLQDEPPASESCNGQARSPFEGRVRTAILGNMTDDQFGVKELAQEIAVSKSHLTHKLKEETGMSTSVYIRSLRLRQAAEMLKNNQGNVSEVAYSVGFNSLSYFSRCFKDQFGSAPSELIPVKD